jgi:hypothetical protein
MSTTAKFTTRFARNPVWLCSGPLRKGVDMLAAGIGGIGIVGIVIIVIIVVVLFARR